MALEDLPQFIGSGLGAVTIKVRPLAGAPGAGARTRVAAYGADGEKLRTAAQTLNPNEIWVNPDFWSPDTAEGLGLIAHEYFHVEQMREDPDFLRKYQGEERRREMEGRAPWWNPYEWPAYEFQAKVERALRAEGHPSNRSYVPRQAIQDIFGGAVPPLTRADIQRAYAETGSSGLHLPLKILAVGGVFLGIALYGLRRAG